MQCQYVLNLYQIILHGYKVSTLDIISIKDLNSHRTGQIFVGDIMVTCNTFLDNNKKSRPIMRADMTNEKGIMTVTVIVPTQLIQCHKQKLVDGNSICITNFKIMLKTNYDRGDCDCIISLNETSTIETVPPTCNEYTFIPNATIKQLSKNTYH